MVCADTNFAHATANIHFVKARGVQDWRATLGSADKSARYIQLLPTQGHFCCASKISLPHNMNTRAALRMTNWSATETICLKSLCRRRTAQQRCAKFFLLELNPFTGVE
jgi:hypothetical protein